MSNTPLGFAVDKFGQPVASMPMVTKEQHNKGPVGAPVALADGSVVMPDGSTLQSGAGLSTAQQAAGVIFSTLPNGASAAPRGINIHDYQLAEPLKQLALPSPYAATFPGVTNNEWAYGTPKYFPAGWKGYKYWAVGGPYPTTVKAACTVSVGATPTLTFTSTMPFSSGMLGTLSSTGALPAGTSASAVYALTTTGALAGTITTAEGATVTTTDAGSGTITFSLYARIYENPVILVSNDGETFAPPPGIQSSPIFDGTAQRLVVGDKASAFADPHIEYCSNDDKLYCAWIWQGRGSSSTIQSFMVSESVDGLTWTAPVEILATSNTAVQPNSPSLIWTGAGWTIVAINTPGSNPQQFLYTKTASLTPYTGWAAPGAAYNSSVWSLCAIAGSTGGTTGHPLGRQWWHQYSVALADGGIMSLAVDGSSAGGTVYSLHSADGGANWSVQPFSAWNTASAGGSFYRPSLCVRNEGGQVSLMGYFSRIGGINAGSAGGFYIEKANLSDGFSRDQLLRLSLRDMVTRKPAAPSPLKNVGLLRWDSTIRVDSASTAGSTDDGTAWTASVGTWGISTNRIYNIPTGNSILSLDTGTQNYDFEVQIQTPGTSWNIIWGFVDSSNFYRFGTSVGGGGYQKVVSGSVVAAATWSANVTFAAGDIIAIRKRNARTSIYLNDRIIDTIADTTFATSTKVALQASGASSTFFTNVIVR